MSATQHANTVHIVVPLLYVENMERALLFYRDQLGFELVEKWEPDQKLTWCRLVRDQAAVMLQQACDEDGPPETRGRGVAFFFLCDDANALHAEFTRSGVQLQPPEVAFYGMNQLFLRDPDGYQLCFQNPTQDT